MTWSRSWRYYSWFHASWTCNICSLRFNYSGWFSSLRCLGSNEKDSLFIKSPCFKNCLKKVFFLFAISCAIASFSILLRLNASGWKKNESSTQQVLIIFKCISQRNEALSKITFQSPVYYVRCQTVHQLSRQ